MWTLKKSVFCTLQFEALHCWPEAFEEVEFLRAAHRHIFHVRCEVSVSHSDREIEFIKLKRQLQAFVDGKYHEINLGRKSCEDIASEIVDEVSNLYTYDFIKVEVSEDGENGAVYEYGNRP